MIMNRILIIFIFFIFHAISNAQQLPLFTQYREYSSIINPAYINSDNFLHFQNLSFGTSYRAQWVGKQRTPRTYVLRGEYAMTGRRGAAMVLGAHAMNDELGPTGFTGVYGRLGTIIGDDPRESGLSVAIAAGLVQHRILASEVVLIDPGDFLGTINQSAIIPDVGFGVFYYHLLDNNDNVYGGVSMPQAVSFDLSYKNERGEFEMERVNHYYAVLGYYKYLDAYNFIEPSLWFRYVPGAPVSMDANLRFQIDWTFWIGLGVGTNKSFHGECGFIIGENLGFDNTIKIGYGFDYFFQDFGPFFGSTHEINLALLLER